MMAGRCSQSSMCVFFLVGIYISLIGELRVSAQNVTLSPSSVHVVEGNSVTLTCSYYAAAQVQACQWQLADQRSYFISGDCNDIGSPKINATLYAYGCGTGTFTWTLKRVRRANNGDAWYCLIYPQNSGLEKSNTVQINVEVPIQSVTMTSPAGSMVDIVENTRQNFVCITSDGLPAPVVWWYKDQGTTSDKSDDANITTFSTPVSKSSGDDLTVVTSTLSYTPNRSDNGMTVFCNANNSDAIFMSKRVQVNVKYLSDGPTIEEDSIYKVIDNKQGELTCYDTGGNPRPALKWFCNGGSENDAGTNGTKVISKVTWTASRNHTGSCTCQSTQTGLTPVSRNASITVDVLYPPDRPEYRVNGNIISGNAKFIESKTRYVHCNSTANSAPDIYTWTKPDSTIINGQQLTLSNIQRSDDGQYVCKAQNLMTPTGGSPERGTQSSNLRINVLFPPDAPKFHYFVNGQTISRESIDMVRGDTFSIACKSEGNPKPSYRWSGSSQDNSILTVSSINNNQNRTCTATNTMQETFGVTETRSAASSLAIIALYPPQIGSCILMYGSSTQVTVTDKINVIHGNSFTVTCNAVSKPEASYSWSGPKTSSSAILTIDTIRNYQNGMYTFIAKNTMVRTNGTTTLGTDRAVISFNILYAPTIGQLTDRSLLIGSLINISCPVERGNPATTVFKWTRDKDNKEWNTDVLYITTISKTDDDIYTCIVKNTMEPTGASVEHGEDRGFFRLNVLYKASVTSFFIQGHSGELSVEVNENDTVSFVCNVESNPKSSVNLQFKGKTVRSQSNTRRLDFTHENATCLDAGVYTCAGGNQHNNGQPSSRQLTVFVRCSPRPQESVKDNITTVTALHVPATLSSTYIAYPVPSQSGVTWQKHDGIKWTTLTNSPATRILTSGLMTNLTISNVTNADYRQYKLIVTNSIGAYTQIYHLISEVFQGEQHTDNSVLIGGVIGGVTVCILLAVVGVILFRKTKTWDGIFNRESKAAKDDRDEHNYTDLQNLPSDANTSQVYASLQRQHDNNEADSKTYVNLMINTT